MTAIAFANEIIAMQRTIEDQAWEINRLREYEVKYHELLDSMLEHNERMVGNTLRLLMTPGVVDACKSETERQKQKDPT